MRACNSGRSYLHSKNRKPTCHPCPQAPVLTGPQAEEHQPLSALGQQEMGVQWLPPMGLGRLGLQSSVLLEVQVSGLQDRSRSGLSIFVPGLSTQKLRPQTHGPGWQMHSHTLSLPRSHISPPLGRGLELDSGGISRCTDGETHTGPREDTQNEGCFLKGPTSPTTPMLSLKALHLRLHHQWPALSHLLHKAEGTHEPLTLQLPQQDI